MDTPETAAMTETKAKPEGGRPNLNGLKKRELRRRRAG